MFGHATEWLGSSLILVCIFILPNLSTWSQTIVERNVSLTTRRVLSTLSTTKLPPTQTTLSTTDRHEWIGRCPCRLCELSSDNHDYRILCDAGGLESIPVLRMDPRLTLIEIDAPADRQNNLTLGPLFYRFSELRILRVRHSRVPAIGRTTFKWRVALIELDLSFNLLSSLEADEFQGLGDLRHLELSYNRLRDLPSGVFHHLTNLVALNLSHNDLNTITTRMFYNLSSLERLDLTSNPLGHFAPQNAIDLWPLRQLRLVSCELRSMHSLFYHNLPALELLDLRFNRLEVLRPHEFRYLKRLNILRLDGNRLKTLADLVFHGVRLAHLGLASNGLEQLNESVFVNTSIVELCLGDNNLTLLSAETFRPLAASLRRLDLSGAGKLGSANLISSLLAPLTKLEKLNLANLSLESISSHGMGGDVFASSHANLVCLNLSHNRIVNITTRLVAELVHLETLDLSHNSLFELSSDFFYSLGQMSQLRTLRLQANPWSCYRCHLLALRNWLVTKPKVYWHDCQADEQRCAVCRFPANLAGLKIDELDESQLEWCTDASVQLRMSTTEPNVGLVLALLIIIILIIVIIAVIIYYRNRGAIYFTNEDLYSRPSNGMGGRESISAHAGGGHDDKSLATNESRVYNVSGAIRHFADATTVETASGSLRSVESFASGDTRLHHSRAGHFHFGRASTACHTRASNGGVPAHSVLKRAASHDRGGVAARPPPPPIASVSIDSSATRNRTESSDLSHTANVLLAEKNGNQDGGDVHVRGTSGLAISSRARTSTHSKASMSRAKRKSLERLEVERKREEARSMNKTKGKHDSHGEAKNNSEHEEEDSSPSRALSRTKLKENSKSNKAQAYNKLESHESLKRSKSQQREPSSSETEASDSLEVVLVQPKKKTKKTKRRTTPVKMTKTKKIASSSSSSEEEEEDKKSSSAEDEDDRPPEEEEEDDDESEHRGASSRHSTSSVNSLPAALLASDEPSEGEEEQDDDDDDDDKTEEDGHHLKASGASLSSRVLSPTSEEDCMTAALAEPGGDEESSTAADEVGSS